MPRPITAVHFRGVKECVELTLYDGRKLVVTPDHRVRTTNGWMEAKDLQIGETELLVGARPPVFPNAEDAAHWTLDVTAHLGYTLDLAANRQRTLAFFRVLGYVLSDGTLSTNPVATGSVFLGHSIDVDSIKHDITLLTGQVMASFMANNTFGVKIPTRLASSFLGLGVEPDKRGLVARHLPAVLTQHTCPLSVVRSFLSGLFGGDGHTMAMRLKDKQGALGGLGWSMSCVGRVAAEQMVVMQVRDAHAYARAQIVSRTRTMLILSVLCAVCVLPLQGELGVLLERCGIAGAHMRWEARTGTSNMTEAAKASRRSKKKKGLAVTERVNLASVKADTPVQLKLVFQKDAFLTFADKIGFAHCCHKQARLDATVLVLRTQELVAFQREALKTFFDEVVSKDGTVGNFATKLAIAKERLAQQQGALHPEVLAWRPRDRQSGWRVAKQPRGGGLTVKALLEDYCGDFETLFGETPVKARYSAAARKEELEERDGDEVRLQRTASARVATAAQRWLLRSHCSVAACRLGRCPHASQLRRRRGAGHARRRSGLPGDRRRGGRRGGAGVRGGK